MFTKVASSPNILGIIEVFPHESYGTIVIVIANTEQSASQPHCPALRRVFPFKPSQSLNMLLECLVGAIQ